MLKPIKNKKHYEKALERIYVLMQKSLKSGSKESDELDILSILVENNEKERFLIEAPNPLEAVKFRLEQLGMKMSDLRCYPGYRSRVSEILSGKRKLSLQMMRTLNDKLGVPEESLLSE
ncbi:MAG: transcriptional regulator [Bacteroidetes bacterium]|nr:MAG: transcriptional regulator [Bacteroidota bacterium]